MSNERMTEQDMHAFGVKIVRDHLGETGHVIESLNDKLGINPQIVAVTEGRRKFVVVRTAGYPDKGAIESNDIALECIAHAHKFGATCYFASVGLSNADIEAEMDDIVTGGALFVAFQGLEIMTYSDRVKAWGEL